LEREQEERGEASYNEAEEAAPDRDFNLSTIL
jgi:hypothetical protein